MTRSLVAGFAALTVSAALVPALSPSAASPAATGGAPDVRAVAGSAGVGDPLFPRAGNGGYRVDHYDLRLRYAPHRRALRATAVISARARARLASFHLDLYGLTVDTVTVDGEAATWSRRGQELVVRPVRPLDHGAGFDVRVRYHGSPTTYTDADGSSEGWVYTDDGAVVVNEPVGAMTVFPSNNHPTDKARYDVAITVPEGLTGVSNGTLTSHRTSGGWTTWRWHEPDQMATYLMTATIGRFRMITGRGPRGLPVRSFVDPRARGAAAVAAKVPAVLRQLSAWYGRYPFVSSGLIIDRAGIGYALEVQTRPVFDGTPRTATLVHELAHQWFGDEVSPRTWQHIWLSEGFATYTEWLWHRRRKPGAAQARFDDLYAVPDGRALWSPPPADPGDAAHLFGTPVYDRGAMALHVLRDRVGARTFLQIAREWVRVNAGGSATTAELRALAERVSGARLGRIFRDWLWRDGRPAGY